MLGVCKIAFNREAEKFRAGPHFAQRLTPIAQHCGAERVGSENNLSLNAIAVKHQTLTTNELFRLEDIVASFAVHRLGQRFTSPFATDDNLGSVHHDRARHHLPLRCITLRRIVRNHIDHHV